MSTGTRSTADLTATYRADAQRFSEVVDAGGDWSAPSPCEGWSAADVVEHVISTQRDFLGRQDVDLPALPEGAPDERWRSHLEAVEAVLADPALGSAAYDSAFGRTTVAATLTDFYGFDLLVHRWDLARALGGDVTWSDGELDRVEAALDGFGEHLYGEGVCRPAVPVADDAPRQVRVLARMGRRA